MMKNIIEKVKEKKNLTREETKEVFAEIMSGKVQTEDIASFLLALKEKKETIDEITGAAEIMRKFATRINVKNENLLDTCGTGGDSADTFNISTISAFVASGAGCSVAKHGNRAVSSKCGSADLLEALGVNIDIGKDLVEKCINEIGIGFLFAPKLHLAMKHAMPARKMIKTRSIFNILGPLTNPAGAKYQLLGVYDESLAETLANVLMKLGSKHAMVIHGKDGLDEITTKEKTLVAELKNNKVNTYSIAPEDFDFTRATKEDLKGGDSSFNAKLALEILNGKKGKERDIVLLNAGSAIYVTDLAKGIEDGIKMAKDSIDSGKAQEKLEKLKKLTTT